MLPMFRKTVTAAVAGIALLAMPVAPAHALGKNERNFLKGVAAAAIVGAIIADQRKRQVQTATPYYVPPAHVAPQPRYSQPEPRYTQPQHRTGRVIGAAPHQGSGLSQTPSAHAFNSYSPADRRAIQRRLAAFGYYSGGIDGAFGPRTHQAIYAFARQAGRTDALESAQGAFSVLDALLA
ncbi:MAG: peptidoglycan-binding domain-containing protein [Pseudorhodobacter sp.]